MKFALRLVAASTFLLFAFSCKSPTVTKTEPQAAAPKADANAPAAKFGSTTITNKELEDFAKTELNKIEREYQEQTYQTKKQALDRLVIQKLVDAKAKAAGKSADDYIKTEVTDKISAPTDPEIQAVYDQAKAAGRELPPMAQIKDQIVSFLRQQKSQTAMQAFQEKLKAEAKVEILLPAYKPPRVEVEAKGRSRGPEKAPITIVEFSDFECPFCGRGEKSIEEVLKTYPSKVRLFYRDFPLPMHSHAQKAAEAAHCAGDQNKYWEMHGKLFENQRALEIKDLKEYAKALKLDTAKFDKCLDSGANAKLVDEGRKAGEALGINGTPAFYVNGIMINGAQPFSAFKEIIDSELAEKK